MNDGFGIGENYEYDIFELFTGEVSKYVIMCINSSKFNLEKLVWEEILSHDPYISYYGNGNPNEDEIFKAILKKNKKIDVGLFLNQNGKFGTYPPIYRFRESITVDNIPDKINTTTCNYIKKNLTLQYTNCEKKNIWFGGPEIEYVWQEDGWIVVTNNNRLKVIIKILMNCKSLKLIREYLKETPTFDFHKDDTLYFVDYMNEKFNKAIYELQKKEFKRLLKEELNSRADSNTRSYITLRKILESHTGRSDIVDTNVNSYEKKLKRVIDGKSISSS